jgi:hypothetical protein
MSHKSNLDPILRVKFCYSNLVLIFILFYFILITNNALLIACNSSFSTPTNKLEFMGDAGELALWKTIGEIKLSDGTEIPLNIGFSSIENYTSILGSGWTFALLDSRVVQIDDNKFSVYLPDGRILNLIRSNDDPNILLGTGFVGKIELDKFTCTSECGLTLKFEKGKLSSISDKSNVKYFLSRDSNDVIKFVSDGVELLKVTPQQNDSSEKIKGYDLISGDSKTQLKIGQRPIVINTSSRKLVEQVVPTLVEIKGNKIFYNFDFSVDSNSLNPTLSTEGYLLKWDSERKNLISENDWVCSTDKYMDVDCFKKVNSKGLIQRYGYNQIKTILQTTGQGPIVTEFYNADALRGKPRKVTHYSLDNTITNQWIYSYDESGKLVRENYQEPGINVHLSISNRNQKATDGRTGLILWEKKYDANNRLTYFRKHDKEYNLNYLDNNLVKLVKTVQGKTTFDLIVLNSDVESIFGK